MKTVLNPNTFIKIPTGIYPPTGIRLSEYSLFGSKILKVGFTLVVALLSNIAFAQEAPDHTGLQQECAEELSVPLSTSDWYDCPFPGDIMHCQGFVEIGSNPSPTNKLEVSHGDDEYVRQGISLNSLRTDDIRTSEIYFRHQNNEQWALGNDLFTRGEHDFFLWDHLNGKTRLYFKGNIGEPGLLGIYDNNNPIATLDVNGDIRSAILSNAGSSDVVQADNSGILHNIPITSFSNDINYWHNSGNDVYRTSSEGKVFIGMNPCSTCTTAGYRFYVEGGIMAREIKVTAASTFPDYVFDTKYKLRSLLDLENYIIQNKHLPNIPAASEIKKNQGFEIGEMQLKLLQTIEEQALYIIDLQKQMDAIKQELVTIKN